MCVCMPVWDLLLRETEPRNNETYPAAKAGFNGEVGSYLVLHANHQAGSSVHPPHSTVMCPRLEKNLKLY
jgi:hypothetical protein